MKRSGGAEFVQWMPYVLDALREQGGSAAPRDVYEIVARLAKVPDEKRFAKMGGGALRFPNQVAWARKYLHWEGLVSSPKRGLWMLTTEGQTRKLTQEESRAIFLKWVRVHAEARTSSKVGSVTTESNSDNETFGSVPTAGYEEELLGLLQSVAPSEFEREDVSKPIELVDGDRLIEVLEEHEFGLRAIATFEVDREFLANYSVETKSSSVRTAKGSKRRGSEPTLGA